MGGKAKRVLHPQNRRYFRRGSSQAMQIPTNCFYLVSDKLLAAKSEQTGGAVFQQQTKC